MKIFLLLMLGYLALWVLWGMGSTLYTCLHYRRDPSAYDHKFSLKSSIEINWMLPGILLFYGACWIYAGIFGSLINKNHARKENKLFASFRESILNLGISGDLNFETEYDFYISRNKDYYIFSVYFHSNKVLGIFKNPEDIISLVNLTREIKYTGITQAEYEKRFYVLEAKGRITPND